MIFAMAAALAQGEGSTVKWLTDVTQAYQLAQKQGKPVFVFAHVAN